MSEVGLSPAHTRESSGLKLDAVLRWWHDGVPVEHPRIVELFNQSLRPAEGGRYQLVVGDDWCFVEVEDCAFGVTAVDETADGGLSVRLTDRTAERLDVATLEVGADGVTTCRVKRGQARARFLRDAQFQLGSRLERDQGQLWLRSGRNRHLAPKSLQHLP